MAFGIGFLLVTELEIKLCKEHTSHDEERGYFTEMRLSNGVEWSKGKISIQGIHYLHVGNSKCSLPRKI